MNTLSSPIFIPLAALVAGIISADAGAGVWIGVAVVFLGLTVYLYLISIRRYPVLFYRLAKIHYVWISLVFAGTGIISADLSRPYVPSEEGLKAFSHMTGIVRGISSRTSGDRITMDIESFADSTGHISESRIFSVVVRTDAAECNVGDILVMPMSLSRITDSENSFFGGYADNMARNGIYYMQHTPSEAISVIGHRITFHGTATSIRDRLAQFIEKRHLHRRTINFLITVLLGERAYLDEDSRTLFANAGIAHILALSGMHIGIIAGIILLLLFPLNFYGRYRLRLIIGLVSLWLYAFITGMAPSTVRACVMVSFITAGIFLERKGNNFNALCLAAFVILVFDPYALWNIGFQLSILCVTSLIAFTGHFNPIGMRRHPRLHAIGGLVLASMASTFASWVVVAYYFGRFPLMFLAGNVLVLPMLPLYMSAAVIYLLLETAGLNINIMGLALDNGVDLLYRVASTVSGDSSFVLDITVGVPTVILWLCGVAAFALAIDRRKKPMFWCAMALCGGAFICMPFGAKASPEGFIICNTPHKVELRVKKGNEERSVNVRTATISQHEIYGKVILTCDVDAESLNPDGLLQKPDYLILTGSCSTPIAAIDSLYHPGMMVIHPSVRIKRERILLTEADSLGIPIHSLRRDRALRVEIP